MAGDPGAGSEPAGPDAGMPEEQQPDVEDSCGESDTSLNSLVVSAPFGVGLQHLGRPVDEDFNPIAGEDGASIFPEGEVFTTALNTIEHNATLIDDKRSFSAHASVLGVSGGADTSTDMRYAVFRAQQIADVHEIDDATAMREPPDGASFYVSRIFTGHSYEVVFSAEKSTFHSGVSGNFLVASGSVDLFAERHHLSTNAYGRGLEPVDGQAIFARTADEIESAYTAAGDPVPILVEYRRIPGACLSDSEKIEWLDPIEVTVNFDQLSVYLDGSSGADTWSVLASCNINGEELWLENDVIWEYKKDISDSCQSGIEGPKGDGNYCPYDLYWSTRLQAVPGDEIACGISGTAWDDQDPVDYAEFSYTVQDQNDPVSGKFGNGNGETEYWMHYSLEFDHPPPPSAE